MPPRTVIDFSCSDGLPSARPSWQLHTKGGTRHACQAGFEAKGTPMSPRTAGASDGEPEAEAEVDAEAGQGA